MFSLQTAPFCYFLRPAGNREGIFFQRGRNLTTRVHNDDFICTVCLVMGLRFYALLPTGSEEREVLGVGNIPVAILPSCQDMKTIAIRVYQSVP